MHPLVPRLFSLTGALLALSVLASPSSAEDLTITFKTSEGTVATHYLSQDRIRMSTGRTDTILDFVTGNIVTIDHQKKHYTEMTVAVIDAAMKAAAAQMERTMANLPPQMREQMATMLGGGAPEATVSKGAVRTIAGHSCQSYLVKLGDSMAQESCNATTLKPPFDPKNFTALARVGVPVMPGMEKLIKKTSAIPGIMLMQHTTITMMGQKAENGLEATSVTAGPIPAEVFAVPTAYQLVASPAATLGDK